MTGLAVLVVSYRRADLLRRCLDSVRAHLPGEPILVWDNHSTESGRIAELAADYPEVSWQFCPRNIGYAAAVNALAARVPDADLLLLNPDAELTGPLSRTRAALREPRVAAASPMLDGEHGWDLARARQTVPRALVGHAGYAARLRGTRFSDHCRGAPAEAEGYLSGCCLLINARAWRELGGFDERCYLYGEESLWQRQARRAGWRLRLAEEVAVRHLGAATSGTDPAGAARSAELLRAGTAIMLGIRGNTGPGTVFLAGSRMLDAVQRSKRRARPVSTGLPHVLLTTNQLCRGGAERQRVLLANELAARGYPVTVVCLQAFGPLTAELSQQVRLLLCPWWQPIVATGRGHAVLITGITNTEAGFALGWRAARAARGRAHRWLVASHEIASSGPTYGGALASVIGRSDGLIALSPAHLHQLRRGNSLPRTTFIAPNGVRPEQPRPYRPGSPLRLGMLGRIVELKNPHLLTAALARLPEADWRLDIFGEGPDRARLAARTPADIAERVHWRGAVDDPGTALEEIDVLCLPSRAEAFPMVLLEAMTRGIPVLATNRGSVPDILDGGEAGLLVEPDVESWTAALRKVLEDPSVLAPYAERGHRKVTERYTVRAMTDAYAHILGSAVRR
ncbi:glycosyltransferase [Sciscionella sediminilitoris]|uniref:glycosyltransferase n=1 Tax=Sciscionella sediminilitoris TaxID=1445613 RepID=UPI0005628EE1|nr:glycosyltransferase [Sciscionella sp. SE31]